MKTPEIPAEFDLETYGLDEAMTIGQIYVPHSVIAFCAEKYREAAPGCIVIAEFYQGEEFLIYIEDETSTEIRATLEREGWPTRLLDCFFSPDPNPDAPNYFRLEAG